MPVPIGGAHGRIAEHGSIVSEWAPMVPLFIRPNPLLWVNSMSARYRITVSGPQSAVLVHAVEELGSYELVASSANQSTILATVMDESALHGVLHRLQTLRVDLLEVVRVDRHR